MSVSASHLEKLKEPEGQGGEGVKLNFHFPLSVSAKQQNTQTCDKLLFALRGKVKALN